MTSSLVEQTRASLTRYHGRYPEIGRKAKLSYSWVTKFAQGRVPNPTIRNIEALRKTLAELDAARVASEVAMSS